MTAPIETTGSQAEAQPEAVLEGVEAKKIEGRSLGQIAWTRFKRDKVAVAGGLIVVLLILIAALSRPLQSMLGLDPNTFNQDLIDANTSLPKGDFGGMSLDHPLGVDPKFGRDILARILEGSWVSLVVAFGATILSNAIGVVLGLVAGYYGGRVDTIVSRLMDTFLAFPLLLFAIAISATLQGGAFGLEGLPLHISVLIFVIGFFNWPYMGRIVRGQTLALREREFIDASRGMGPAARTSCSRSCCPTSSRRSSSTRPCSSRPTSSSRRRSASSASGSSRRRPPGAECSTTRSTSSRSTRST